MSTNKHQDGAKMARKARNRARKAEVWGDTPHRLRRMVVKGDCTMADVPALIRKTRHDTGTVTGRFNTVERSDDFHAAIEAPIPPATTHGASLQEWDAIDNARAKRSEAAKRAAATRKANRERKQ